MAPTRSVSGQRPAPALARSAAATVRTALMALARLNLLFAAALAAAAWLAARLAGVAAEPRAPAAAFLAFFAVYALDRAADAATDDHAHPQRAAFSRRHARRMAAAAVAALAGAAAVAWPGGPAAVGAALLPLGAVLLYTFPWIPGSLARRVGARRVKEVPVLKNVWVSGTLAATPVLLVATLSPPGGEVHVLAGVAAFFFARFLVNNVLFDLRDLPGDRAQGLRTIPVLLGRARTLRLLHAANLAIAAGLAAAAAAGWAPALPLLASSVYAAAYLRAFAAGRDPHFACDVLSDGELLVLAGIVWLVGAG